ncbi:MAG: UDP-3-O-[3-hydroxymyristoyl] N-acetylglucosamine deacetylase [Deltaproteobacteria bacterium RBG_16_47_11]|nr:MAG: UDP-3-O-[3-hydroxymyristoyl] N-acetylglucosamine deacetylase [Deltaproteobacteria bacterium RBG_16_47_11]
MEKKVLIVDDEERVVQSIAGVLEDEGFRVAAAKSGEEAIGTFQREIPDVTLLDIWMPGMDGIEVLKRFKGISPDCQVIMISGHATISTAMAAVKLGAFDFIEKPISLDALLMTIHRALDCQEELREGEQSGETLSRKADILPPPPSFIPETHPAKEVPKRRSTSLSLQRTIRKSVVLYGTGLHSGMKTGLSLSPLLPHSGILFGNVSYDEVVPAHLDYVQTTEYATSLKKGRAVAKTIEHLMAVLHAYRITNLMVKMIEEIPIMDGSALEFCRIIEEAGIEEQEERVDEIVIDRKLEVVHKNKSLVIEPSESFSIHYFLDYPSPIGKQALDFTVGSEEAFKEQIAPARTFGFLRDIEMLERMGLASGGRLNNFILVDDEKIVNTELRFSDEFVRHKVLDLIGDFYLLNRPVRGKVTAHLTGHTENIALMKKIQEEIAGKKQ